MDPHPFIFSDRPGQRLLRHGIFWGAWWLSQSFLYSFTPGLMGLSYFQRVELSSVDALLYLAPHVFLAYSLMYFVIPKFVVKGKYLETAILILVLFIATGAFSAFIAIDVLEQARQCIFRGSLVTHQQFVSASFFLSLLAGLRGSLTIGGLAAAIKLMKYWYVKQQRNLELQKENIASQLQLLKAQVHPHFLFNTLNNVYAHAQVGSASAPVLIAGLSDLLRYMLYEGSQPLVPFSKELKMIEDYFLLERVRYGNKLDVNLELPADTKGLFIAPLLLLPFVENCFKHGASHILDQPWVSMRIVVEGDWMMMKLLNGKLPAPVSSVGGIGIANTTKRLDLLYPQKHQLSINNEEEVFIVNLKLRLERRPVSSVVEVTAHNNHYELAK